MAIVWQPIVGGISDRTVTRWGSRRPFIAAGTAGDVIFLAGIALAGNYFWLSSSSTSCSKRRRTPPRARTRACCRMSFRWRSAGRVRVLRGVQPRRPAAGVIGAGLHAHAPGRVASRSLRSSRVLVATMVATVVLVPDTAAPVEGQFDRVREVLRKTFGAPLRHRDFLWLMASRLLIFMGFGGCRASSSSTSQRLLSRATAKRDRRRGSRSLAWSSASRLWSAGPPLGCLSASAAVRFILVVGPVAAPRAARSWSSATTSCSNLRAWLALAELPEGPDLAAQATLGRHLVGIGYGLFFSVDWAFIQDVIPR